jgi:hypothetical protein
MTKYFVQKKQNIYNSLHFCYHPPAFPCSSVIGNTSPSPSGQRSKLSQPLPLSAAGNSYLASLERSLRVRLPRKLSPLSFISSPAFPCPSVLVRGTYIPTDCTDLH